MKIKMETKIKATRENIFSICNAIAQEGTPVEQISRSMLEKRMNGKGNTKNVATFLAEWKETQTKPSGVSMQLNDMFASFSTQIALKHQAELDVVHETHKNKITELSSTMSEMEEEIIQLRDFKNTFKSLIDSLNLEKSSLKNEINSLGEKILALEVECAKQEQRAETAIQQTALKHEELLAHQKQYLIFTKEHTNMLNATKVEHDSQLEGERLRTRQVQLKLEQTEEKYTQMFGEMAAKNESIRSLTEQAKLKEDIAQINKAADSRFDSFTKLLEIQANSIHDTHLLIEHNNQSTKSLVDSISTNQSTLEKLQKTTDSIKTSTLKSEVDYQQCVLLFRETQNTISTIKEIVSDE